MLTARCGWSTDVAVQANGTGAALAETKGKQMTIRQIRRVK